MQLTLISQDENVARVRVVGDVDHLHVPSVGDPLAELLGESLYSQGLLLNLEGVKSLDSSGVGWLLTCNKRFREHKGAMVLYQVSPAARNVLRVLNMHLVFKIAETEEQGLEMLRDMCEAQ